MLQATEWANKSLLSYLTHWDVVFANTFITASSGILLLTTINFYQHLHHPNLPIPAQSHTTIHVLLTVISSFLLLLPRFMEFTIMEHCNGMTLNSSSCVCSEYGKFCISFH